MAKSILEHWRTYPSNSNYMVSTCGEVKSVDRYGHVGNCKGYMRLYKGKILKQHIGTHGYKTVKIEGKTVFVHRMVAETFLLNPDNLLCVNHKDENKTNNWVTNLEWCTHKYNTNYGTAISRITLTKSKPILQFSRTGEFIQEWESGKYAARYNGWDQGDINRCCLGQRKTAYNYIWKFKEL